MARLTRDYTTRAGRKILIIDDVVSEQMAKALYEYFHFYAGWSFDNVEDIRGDNVPSVFGLPNELIENSPLWAILNKYIQKFFGPDYKPYNCSVNHTRFGDTPTIHRDTYDKQVQDITLLLYLNPEWNVDFSGETVYFDEQNEIEFSVLPKFCRLAIHEGYIKHASRTPTALFRNSRYTLAIKATPDKKYLATKLAEEQEYLDGDKVQLSKKLELEKQIFGQIWHR